MAVFRGERTAWRYSHRLFANRSPPPMLRPVTLLCCFAAGSEARIDAMNRHVITRCRNRIGRSRAGRLDISICYASGNTRNREARYLRTVVRINCVLYPYQSINYHYHYHYHTIYLSQKKTQYLLLKNQRQKKQKTRSCKLHSPSLSSSRRRRPPWHSPVHRTHQRCYRAAGASSTTSSALRPVFCPARSSVRIAAVSSNSPGGPAVGQELTGCGGA